MALLRGIAIAGIVTLGTLTAHAASDVSQDAPGHGKINWTDKTITVTGSGAPNLGAANVAVARLGAERAAKMDALRNIIEAVKGVKVSGTTTAAGVMDAKPEVRAKVQGVVQGFKVLDTKYYSDGGVDLVVQVPLSGVTEALVDDAGTKATGGKAGGTTGVIVNAKGLEVSPALAPRILNEKGKEVFASGNVNKDSLRKSGACGYNKSLTAAKKDPRVGETPLVVKALRIPEKGSADLVIADADAAKLQAIGAVLAKGSVIIVTD